MLPKFKLFWIPFRFTHTKPQLSWHIEPISTVCAWWQTQLVPWASKTGFTPWVSSKYRQEVLNCWIFSLLLSNAIITQLLLYFHVTGDRTASFCGGDSHIGRSHWKHVVWREKLIPLVRMQPRSRTTSSLTSPSSSFGNPRQKRLQIQPTTIQSKNITATICREIRLT